MRLKRIFCNSLWLFMLIHSISHQQASAQFAPQAGQPGSTAIHMDSSVIISWANNCTISRGWMDIADTTLGKAILGSALQALGKADQDVVSLGDGGTATYYFENPIRNGAGYDFAVFENGFLSPVDANLAFLELATVEVSSDGINYFAFAPESLHDTAIQIAGYGDYMDARKVHHLAGKYISGYGTPFDLDELSGIPALDITLIKFVRIRDVTGSLNDAFCSRDLNQRKINDPYPTPFPSSGFDLDALAVMHHAYPLSQTNLTAAFNLMLYPNPAQHTLYWDNQQAMSNIQLRTMDGQLVLSKPNACTRLDISNIASGVYVFSGVHHGNHFRQIVVKHD
jgi:hypothetical protein